MYGYRWLRLLASLNEVIKIGLDMYLEYKKYLYNWTGNDNDALKELLLSMYGLPHKPTSVTMEAGYWRKVGRS